MRLPLFLLPALVLAAAFACNDYDAADQTAAPVEAGATDAVTDAGSTEAAPEPTGFCAKKGDAAVWCEDFDSLTDLSSLVPGTSDSTIAPQLSRKTFRSEPQSVVFMVPPDAGAGYTVISRGVVTDRQMRFELDWQWPTFVGVDGETLQSVTIKQGQVQASWGRACGVGDGGPPPCTTYIASCEGGACTLHEFESPSLTAWSHVALQARFGASGHILFEQDGKALVDTDAPTSEPIATEPVTATIGVAVLQGKSGGIELFFDNVFATLL